MCIGVEVERQRVGGEVGGHWVQVHAIWLHRLGFLIWRDSTADKKPVGRWLHFGRDALNVQLQWEGWASIRREREWVRERRRGGKTDRVTSRLLYLDGLGEVGRAVKTRFAGSEQFRWKIRHNNVPKDDFRRDVNEDKRRKWFSGIHIEWKWERRLSSIFSISEGMLDRTVEDGDWAG